MNLQAPEKPVVHPRFALDVFKIFHTIQGEGPFQGMPAIFIRLAGCSLQCPLCDTDYTSQRKLMNPPQITTACQQIARGCLIVITGGEPFRQQLGPTVRMLLNCGYGVQIETNGIHYEKGFPYSHKDVVIACSPKTPKIHPELHVHYYKYVLDAEHVDKEDGLPTSVLGMDFRPARPVISEINFTRPQIYITPADEQDEEKNTKNLTAAVKSVMTYGYRLNIQLQKLIGME